MTSDFSILATSKQTSRRSSAASRPLRRGKACINCRTLKIKCSGERPVCEPCLNNYRLDPCEYTDGPSTSRTQEMEATIAQLKERITELERSGAAPVSPMLLHDPYSQQASPASITSRGRSTPANFNGHTGLLVSAVSIYYRATSLQMNPEQSSTWLAAHSELHLVLSVVLVDVKAALASSPIMKKKSMSLSPLASPRNTQHNVIPHTTRYEPYPRHNPSSSSSTKSHFDFSFQDAYSYSASQTQSQPSSPSYEQTTMASLSSQHSAFNYSSDPSPSPSPAYGTDYSRSQRFRPGGVEFTQDIKPVLKSKSLSPNRRSPSQFSASPSAAASPRNVLLTTLAALRCAEIRLSQSKARQDGKENYARTVVDEKQLQVTKASEVCNLASMVYRDRTLPEPQSPVDLSSGKGGMDQELDVIWGVLISDTSLVLAEEIDRLQLSKRRNRPSLFMPPQQQYQANFQQPQGQYQMAQPQMQQQAPAWNGPGSNGLESALGYSSTPSPFRNTNTGWSIEESRNRAGQTYQDSTGQTWPSPLPWNNTHPSPGTWPAAHSQASSYSDSPTTYSPSLPTYSPLHPSSHTSNHSNAGTPSPMPHGIVGSAEADEQEMSLRTSLQGLLDVMKLLSSETYLRWQYEVLLGTVRST